MILWQDVRNIFMGVVGGHQSVYITSYIHVRMYVSFFFQRFNA